MAFSFANCVEKCENFPCRWRILFKKIYKGLHFLLWLMRVVNQTEQLAKQTSTWSQQYLDKLQRENLNFFLLQFVTVNRYFWMIKLLFHISIRRKHILWIYWLISSTQWRFAFPCESLSCFTLKFLDHIYILNEKLLN